MTTEVRNDETRSRYELLLDGEVIGFADYRIEGTEVVFPHTVIDPAHRGRGFGDVLVTGAMLDVRAAGRTVVPQCWFVVEFLELHPEFADLRAA